MATIPKIPKPQEERVRESLVILQKLIDELQIPATNPSIRLFKKRMSEYWESGLEQQDRIPLVGSNRHILYRFPRWAHQEVEVVLRVSPIKFQRLPSNLVAEIEAQTNSALPPGPEHPSPQESAEK
jgi:hypothetical protein